MNAPATRPRMIHLAQNEVQLSDYVPYTAHITPTIIKTREGAFLSSWKVDGIPFETTDIEDLAIRHEGFNQLLRSFDGSVSIWAHRVRRPVTDRLSEEYPQAFARDLAVRYHKTFSERMMTNDTYLTVLFRPPLAAMRENPFLRIISGGNIRSLDEIRESEREGIRQIEMIANQIEAGLKKYQPEALGMYEENGKEFSSQLEFLGFLINGQWRKVGVQPVPIKDYLASSRLFFHGEKLEIRAPDSVMYGAALDLKDYPQGSKPGILDPLLYTSYSYIETQSFSILNKPAAKYAIELQRRQLQAAEDAASGQIEALNYAIEQLIDGAFVLGEYHYSLIVFGDSPTQAVKHLANAQTLLNDAGYQAAHIDLVADSAWFAQQPGNWKYRTREAKLTSRNFCGTSALHGFGSGKRNRNPWGEAVTILKTPNGAPYYFNWHGTPDDDDSTDKKAPANTTIIGMTGSGKTVLELFLIVMSLKYGPTLVFFDKDRGAEIAIRALGGNYRTFKRGQPTGMNPFQLPVTEVNLRFEELLVKSLVPRTLNPQEESALSSAIRQLAELEKPLRRLSTLIQMLPINQEDGGLPAYLKKWCKGGALGWVLDNSEDKIDLSAGKIFGFDDTDFLEDKEILAPVTMYLLHLTETLIDGRRFMYVMAEFWKRLESPVFADFAVNKQYTIRKQNGFGIFDTQSPAQILKSPHVAAMVEQSATQIFLPNPKADRKDYVEGFKVTEAEFKKIRSLGESSRQFLVKQGHRSTVVQLDLGGLGDMLDVLSTTTDNVELLDEIRIEHGDNPNIWMPIFMDRLAARRKKIN